MKNLIIVESPAKARTITNFLSKEYKVIASKGHIRDLPKSTFGIDIDDKTGDLVPKYSIPREANPTVKELKKLAKEAETVYIATDEDREGEAIGYHIAMAIGKEPTDLPRIVFHEITKTAIQHALENPRKVDMHSVDAQQTRRLLDRIVGYKLSPLLAAKIQKGLSAGRVQSSTLKLVVDREREIKAFVPEEFWTIDALFEKDIEASIYDYDGLKIEKLTIKTEKDATQIVASAKAESFTVASLDKTQRKTKTPPPFMTSTLQQAASTQLGFSPKKTMMVAQKLYEGVKTDKGTSGVITYMRTDSLNLAKEAVESAREYIKTTFGQKYLPEKPKYYTSKSKGAQEAHEAIRPTMVEFDAKLAANYLNVDELKLYKLIYNRFLACQMTEAEMESQTLLFKGDKCTFKASGRKLLFDGFYKVTGYTEKDKLLPELAPGQAVTMDSIKQEQHFTEPPARYNEASLIKKLESLGIGRPSTYAPTVTTLQARSYIEIEQKRIHPTEVAFTVTEMLEEHFPEIVDSGFTANMEETLDEVAEGQTNWQTILKAFYTPFLQKVEEGKAKIKSLKMAIPTGENCPKCGSELLLRKGRYGEFVACSNFPKCKYTKNTDGTEIEGPEETDEKCDKCGGAMVIKDSKRGKFLACSAYPKCKNAKSLEPAKELTVPCPECGGKLQEREGKRGKFFGCVNYPKCKFIANFEPVDKKCPQCDYTMGKKTLKSGEVYECFKCKYKEEAK
ncbi:MAG TPA: type I DNA topoisomerase [Sulfurovum sp.]|jgi:DNA topoisomerase-1|nr:MAG: DNA topoisomerase I [Sulfurovum sp. 35-42-20]OYY57418.1 MAG: DNA topoisomerase I [Sulfurovum sp. 28-43-6]OYZ26420.1 MAG: DNA topoisomerase I [Sulfurovum sp. 16-42-52]OYZ49813.1 MAG: DNA topoisomerase I [Sulfurovum sp. 24-42-9]OZA46378.1 MAG: DNA topoisomerase I [Sulfurovum sp. 17-42-90]OZA60174.1 MAG: DNA topoisomerase I [Sulfurovum sp. 39-42-12]HQR73753.1 type I DNA topoisomerase [Sulfurovum sp.]